MTSISFSPLEEPRHEPAAKQLAAHANTKRPLIWKEDGDPIIVDGEVRPTLSANVGDGEYRVRPSYSLGMRFAGYSVNCLLDRKKPATAENKRPVKGQFRTSDAAMAAAQLDYESLPRAARAQAAKRRTVLATVTRSSVANP